VKQRARVLLEWGHEVEVATADDPNSAFIKDFPLKIHALGPGQAGFARASKLGEWLDKHVGEYDALIANGIWQYGCVALRKAALAAKKPYWVFTHGMLDPYFNRAFPLKRIKKMLFWPIQHPVLRDAAAVLFTCEEERILARQSFRPYKVREKVVAYGTAGPQGDPEAHRQAFREKFPDLADNRFLLFLSRIDPKKGCDILLEAFAKVAPDAPDLNLAMAGPCTPEYRAELDTIVNRLGIGPRIVWTGMIQGDVKWGAFRCAEAFVLPSHQENFGIAVVEALASGLPVLISKPVNIWREIEADGAGFIDEDTAEGCEKVLRQWLGASAAERTLMATQAEVCFRSRFTVEGSAKGLLDAIAAG
jgi:glycosyltransferase involved in cell wall biosynthesis